MGKKVKRISSILIFLILAFAFTEIAMRVIFGFGNPPLFESSDVYGYRLIPNQDIRRFGNRIFYNAQGLRNEPIELEPSAGTTRILCVGDSITYGGAIMDQAKTYPYQLEAILNSKSPSRFEILNASAPSWSIIDEENYLLAHGIYNSHIVILQTSKDDLFQEKCRKEVVGKLPSYPSKKPILALQEIFDRYLPVILDKIKPKSHIFDDSIEKGSVAERSLRAPTDSWGEAISTSSSEIASSLPSVAPRNDTQPHLSNRLEEHTVRQENQLKLNITSLAGIKNYVNAKGGRLIIVFIGSRFGDTIDLSFVESGKKRLFETIDALDIDFVNLDEKFSSSEGDRLLRDKIHPNPEGNKVIVEALAEYVLNTRVTTSPGHQVTSN